MRDLQKDLETCNNATPGPWDVFPEVCGPEGQTVFQIESGGDICDVADPYPRGENRPTSNMRFIAKAREGWPHAIERATKAEALNRELIEVLDFLLHRKYTGDTEERILGAIRLLAKAKGEDE